MYVCLMTEEVPDMKTADLVEVYPGGTFPINVHHWKCLVE